MIPAASAPDAGAALAPVARADRIAVLDVLRGFAILGIFFLNIGQMGAPVAARFGDGWSEADFAAFAVLHVFVDGTQRGLLQILFGAGMMILTARAVDPNGPIAIADLYFRRTLWLFVFGLFNMFGLLWQGDILHGYALAGLALFSFRRVAPRWLIVLGLAAATFGAVQGGLAYRERTALLERAAAADAEVAAHRPLDAAAAAARSERSGLTARYTPSTRDRQNVEKERAARAGGVMSYVRFHWALSGKVLADGIWLALDVAQSLCVMLIGVALWKWRVLQGGRSTRFYLAWTLLAYAAGLGARWLDLQTILIPRADPSVTWLTEEYARIAVTLGHIGLVNLAMKRREGRWVLAPFAAAGRTAFSLYLLQSLIGLWWVFAPWGLGLWGGYGWAGLTIIAFGLNAVLLIAANLWVRVFALGPFEWMWRSLAYGRAQPIFVRSGRLYA